MCVEIHKSGNCYKKLLNLKIPLSTIRAIFKKFKATGTVTNLPGRGPMFIFPKLPLDVTLHANKLFGRHAKKKPFLSFHHKCELHTTVTLTGTPVLWSDETKKIDLYKKVACI